MCLENNGPNSPNWDAFHMRLTHGLTVRKSHSGDLVLINATVMPEDDVLATELPYVLKAFETQREEAGHDLFDHARLIFALERHIHGNHWRPSSLASLCSGRQEQ